MRAYNIDILTRPAVRSDPENKGWCFGLPPGIAPEQWPLDPNNGYPLMHGFTLLLPEDYRCHGPDIVALSVFGTPCDHCNGGPELSEAIKAVFAPDAPEPRDPELAALWACERRRHPLSYRMVDGLGCAYAAILLSAEEFAGPLCRPPDVVPCVHREGLEEPMWLEIGSAAAFWWCTHPRWETEDYRRHWLFNCLGEVPSSDLAYDRAIRYAERPNDPNAGVPTCGLRDADQTGYQSRYHEVATETGEMDVRERDWALDQADAYIGGTMKTSQSVPRFSPYHLGFGDEFGGFNFGGGRAQLDFKDMKLDWACG